MRNMPLFFILLGMAFIGSNCLASIAEYPQQTQFIARAQSDYSSPENTYFAIHSCTIAEDLDWCDETMTPDSLKEHIQLFKDANIDRKKIFELAKNVRQSLIVDKFKFKDVVVLLVEDHSFSGSINIMPLTFAEENGQWKLTNRYASDEEFQNFFYYVPPLFDGKGQRPADANSFLGYEQPTQVKTELTADTTNYTVHVYYGKTVDPATFTAKLNKQDISSQFSPKPFTDQEVAIPLQKGRNVLVLSIEGTRKNGKKARDTDRLVFWVP